ncbi:MAG: WD40 repeat domain-containing protein, partial [Candidatus Competibacteraceae bacterium]|nr:WD40 repeat domain-containing protein [Candidatus Competibacteraceae bacterium]
ALWSIHNMSTPQFLAIIDTGYFQIVNTIDISPDGYTLVSSGTDNRVTLWDIRIPSAPQQLVNTPTGHTSSTNDLDFDSDGYILASGSEDNTVRLWDVHDPSAPQQLGDAFTGHTHPVNSITFSPTDNLLASGSDDHTVILWDIRDPSAPQQLGDALTGHGSSVTSIAFSPNGDILASGSENGSIILTDTDVELWQDLACRKIGRELTQDEINKYVPQQFQSQVGTACFKYLQGLTSTLTGTETSLFISRPIQSPHKTFVKPGKMNGLSVHVQPVPVACGNSRFWASGLMNQSKETDFNNLKVHLPARTQPFEIWLVVEGIPTPPPNIGGVSAQLLTSSNTEPGLSLWGAVITPTMTTVDEAMILVQSHAIPTAIFLFEPDPLLFEASNLTSLFQINQSLTYPLKLPATNSDRVDLLLPLVGLTHQDNNHQQKQTSTELVVEYNGQHYRIVAEEPNLGNGLFMAQLEIDLNLSMSAESDRLLALSATTNNHVYTFGLQQCSFPIANEISTTADLSQLKTSERVYLPLLLSDNLH